MFTKLLKPFLAEDTSSSLLWVMLMFIVIMAVVGPLLVIQALNILFNLNIAYSFQSWCAVVIIHAFFNVAVRVK